MRETREVVYATSDRRISENQRKISGPIRKLRADSTDLVEPPKLDTTVKSHEESLESVQKRKTSELLESDRGRLFVRVLKVKKIGLPGLEGKHAKFNMILDNGLHSITTPYKVLSTEVSMEQEFELVVGTNLEFIMTLKAKWPKTVQPPVSTSRPASIASSKFNEKKTGFSKLFGGSKKKTAVDKLKPSHSPTKAMSPQRTPIQTSIPVKDFWEDLTAVDGSFGRVYVAFSQYESEIYGCAATFEIPCYNEWSTVIKPSSTTPGPKKTRREPYQIGTLQVQMMFVPRKSQKETLPRSIKEALSDLRMAAQQQQKEQKTKEDLAQAEILAKEEEERTAIKHEGYLSQLGGDCKYWRRRYFKLDGPTLTAYSETSHKPRVSINLSKAARVIQDKSTLTEPTVVVGSNTSSTSAGRRRRKSAFAETEDAFMFVDEGFRIRFLNGEIIDFYADEAESKQEWVKALVKVIESVAENKVKDAATQQEKANMSGGTERIKPWVELVLERKKV